MEKKRHFVIKKLKDIFLRSASLTDVFCNFLENYISQNCAE